MLTKRTFGLVNCLVLGLGLTAIGANVSYAETRCSFDGSTARLVGEEPDAENPCTPQNTEDLTNPIVLTSGEPPKSH